MKFTPATNPKPKSKEYYDVGKELLWSYVQLGIAGEISKRDALGHVRSMAKSIIEGEPFLFEVDK
jgi:hypothetical protein